MSSSSSSVIISQSPVSRREIPFRDRYKPCTSVSSTGSLGTLLLFSVTLLAFDVYSLGSSPNSGNIFCQDFFTAKCPVKPLLHVLLVNRCSGVSSGSV